MKVVARRDSDSVVGSIIGTFILWIIISLVAYFVEPDRTVPQRQYMEISINLDALPDMGKAQVESSEEKVAVEQIKTADVQKTLDAVQSPVQRTETVTETKPVETVDALMKQEIIQKISLSDEKSGAEKTASATTAEKTASSQTSQVSETAAVPVTEKAEVQQIQTYVPLESVPSLVEAPAVGVSVDAVDAVDIVDAGETAKTIETVQETPVPQLSMNAVTEKAAASVQETVVPQGEVMEEVASVPVPVVETAVMKTPAEETAAVEIPVVEKKSDSSMIAEKPSAKEPAQAVDVTAEMQKTPTPSPEAEEHIEKIEAETKTDPVEEPVKVAESVQKPEPVVQKPVVETITTPIKQQEKTSVETAPVTSVKEETETPQKTTEKIAAAQTVVEKPVEKETSQPIVASTQTSTAANQSASNNLPVTNSVQVVTDSAQSATGTVQAAAETGSQPLGNTQTVASNVQNAASNSRKELTEIDWFAMMDSDEYEGFSSGEANSTIFASSGSGSGTNSLSGSSGSSKDVTSPSSTAKTTTADPNKKDVQKESNLEDDSFLRKTSSASEPSDSEIPSAMQKSDNGNGGYKFEWADGKTREPITPLEINLSEESRKLIDFARIVKITFIVNQGGDVPLMDINIQDATLNPFVKTEIQSIISKWRFQPGDSIGKAAFSYEIKLNYYR